MLSICSPESDAFPKYVKLKKQRNTKVMIFNIIYSSYFLIHFNIVELQLISQYELNDKIPPELDLSDKVQTKLNQIKLKFCYRRFMPQNTKKFGFLILVCS